MIEQLSLLDSPLPSQQAARAHFDAARGIKRRDEGVRLVEMSNSEFIERMRDHARLVYTHVGEVHIDALRRFAFANGIKPKSSAAWGAIFREKGWKQTGEYRASELVTNHGHRSPVWRWHEQHEIGGPS